jgi:hypothetical protein
MELSPISKSIPRSFTHSSAIFLSGSFAYLTAIGLGIGYNDTESLLLILIFGFLIDGSLFLVSGKLSLHAGGEFVNKNLYDGCISQLTVIMSLLLSTIQIIGGCFTPLGYWSIALLIISVLVLYHPYKKFSDSLTRKKPKSKSSSKS